MLNFTSLKRFVTIQEQFNVVNIREQGYKQRMTVKKTIQSFSTFYIFTGDQAKISDCVTSFRF